jgi:hypothetical protein
MGGAYIKQGLILATLAALVSGCSAWTGPRAKVEERRVPGADRPKAVASKTTGGAGVSQAPNRKATKTPQREERQAANEDASLDAKNGKDTKAPGAHASADVTSSDYQVLDMKPSRSSR